MSRAGRAPRAPKPAVRAASGGISAVTFLLERDGLYLLQQRTRDAPRYPDAWCFPGGHIEPGETPLECVTREIEEECGLVLDPSRLRRLVTYEHDGGEKDDVYLCRLEPDARIHLNEGRAMAWLALEDIRRLALAFEQQSLISRLSRELTRGAEPST